MSRLRSIDRALGVFSWVAAGALVLMLFVGPIVIAEDEPVEMPAAEAGSEAGGDGGAAGSEADGAALFTENCGGCHTLDAAGTTGAVGPSLDDTGFDPEQIAAIVSDGSGAMPSFSDDLDPAEIDAIAQFVAGSSGP